MAWLMQAIRDSSDFDPIGGKCAAVCIFSAHRATSRTLGNRWEGQMTTPLLQACLTWEAGRADLAASFHHLVPGLPGSPQAGPAGAGYRARARWAGMGALLLGLGCLASVV
jgi:hypothetical protein